MALTMNQTIEALYAEADSNWENLSEEKALAADEVIFKKISKLAEENDRRCKAAKAKESNFSKENWESGLVNAGDMFYDSDSLLAAEYWEAVVTSAEFMRDTEK